MDRFLPWLAVYARLLYSFWKEKKGAGRMVKEGASFYRIKDLEETERPRERLEKHGAHFLSNAELLGILLRTGVPGENAVQVGTRLLQDFGGLLGLHRATFQEVCQERGLGNAKAAQVKAALEIGVRLQSLLSNNDVDVRLIIHRPDDAAELVKYEMATFTQEHLWVLLMDTRNRVLEIERLYKGSLNSSMVRVGELFRSAIQRSAASIILVHNHPSGDPNPSPEDVALTRSAVQAGKLLDIEVLDHLVIGTGKFVSLKQLGMGF
jgi:DNA repair protein RadC